jgi:hypothetical protein
MRVKLDLSHTLREEHSLRMFKNRVLRRLFGPKGEEVARGWSRQHNEELRNLYTSNVTSSFLGSTAQLRPWPPPQNPAEFLGGFSTTFFSQGRVIPTPNPHPGGPGLCIYIPQRQGGCPFSRLLRHAWVTVGLFLFPGHHTGTSNISRVNK